jgi:hypothetical protein
MTSKGSRRGRKGNIAKGANDLCALNNLSLRALREMDLRFGL